MNMPCKCEDTDEARILKERGLPSAMLRFIGGFNKTPSGPYAQYETGKVYEVHAKFANQKIYPYWEPCEKEENPIATEDDEGVFMTIADEVVIEEDEAEFSTDSSEDVVAVTEEVESDSSTGLTTLGFTLSQGGDVTESTGFSEQEAIRGMDKATLQAYIVGNNGKVDARWGRKRLIQEALKL